MQNGTRKWVVEVLSSHVVLFGHSSAQCSAVVGCTVAQWSFQDTTKEHLGHIVATSQSLDFFYEPKS